MTVRKRQQIKYSLARHGKWPERRRQREERRVTDVARVTCVPGRSVDCCPGDASTVGTRATKEKKKKGLQSKFWTAFARCLRHSSV